MDKPKLWLNFTLKFFRQPLPVVAPNQGWTLIEMAAVSVVVGILAAMSFPSMAGMQAKNQLRSAMSEVEGAFREAQRNAIKRGATCTVSVTAGTETAGTINSSTTPGCISLSVAMPRNVTLASTSTTINFSFKGNPSSTNIDAGNDEVIRVSSSMSSLEERCLVISPGIGLMRSGYWDSSGSGSCTTAL
jgi:prepilin-type N-terminal cleavage/methylation domain-containing protein